MLVIKIRKKNLRDKVESSYKMARTLRITTTQKLPQSGPSYKRRVMPLTRRTKVYVSFCLKIEKLLTSSKTKSTSIAKLIFFHKILVNLLLNSKSRPRLLRATLFGRTLERIKLKLSAKESGSLF